MEDSEVFDADRLDAVIRSALLDSDREAIFDELTKTAAVLLDAPFAFMTAVDDTRSYWKSTFGIDDGTRQNAVGDSFCQYVIERRDGLIVGDATRDPLTSENPSIESMGVRAWAGFPVYLGEYVLGSFCVVDQRPRAWTDEDRRVLHSLAKLASREIELRVNARGLDEDAKRARLDALRSSLLPAAIEPPDGLDVAAHLEPATDGPDVLGDFYDAFDLDGAFAIVVGDVCGHGVDAAKLTALVRYSLRAALADDADPAAALAATNRAVHDDTSDAGRFATVYVLILRPAETGWELRVGRAGHPRALLAADDSAGTLDTGATGPPVGALARPAYVTGSHVLRSGDALLLYTDGVTECRDDAEVLFGDEGLADAVRSAGSGASADELVEAVLARLHAHSAQRRDDRVLIAVRAA